METGKSARGPAREETPRGKGEMTMLSRFHWKAVLLGLGGATLVLTGCSSDEGGAAPLAPPDPGTQQSSFEISLTDIDDQAVVSSWRGATPSRSSLETATASQLL